MGQRIQAERFGAFNIELVPKAMTLHQFSLESIKKRKRLGIFIGSPRNVQSGETNVRITCSNYFYIKSEPPIIYKHLIRTMNQFHSSYSYFYSISLQNNYSSTVSYKNSREVSFTLNLVSLIVEYISINYTILKSGILYLYQYNPLT